jgi:hypothetical protein
VTGQGLEHGGVRVTEAVAGADRDDGERGRDGAHERLAARRAAPVMTDLQEVGAQIHAGGEQLRFRGALRVAREEHGARPHRDAHDDGGVVRSGPGIDVGARRQHVDPRGARRPRAAAELPHGAHRNGAPTKRTQEARELTPGIVALAEARVPDLAHLELRERARHAAVVIGVRVREHHDVEPAAATRAEHGQEDTAPGVRADRARAPTVHEQGAPIGQIDEHRIALTDVEHRHAQHVARRPVGVSGELESREREHGGEPDASSSRGQRPGGGDTDRDRRELRVRRRRQHEPRPGCLGRGAGDRVHDPQRTRTQRRRTGRRIRREGERRVEQAKRKRRQLAHRHRENIGRDRERRMHGAQPHRDRQTRERGGDRRDPERRDRPNGACHARDCLATEHLPGKHAARGRHAEGKGQVADHERLEDRAGGERPAQATEARGLAPEHPHAEAHAHHPGGPLRRAGPAGEVGVEPRRSETGGGGEPSDVEPRGERRNAAQHAADRAAQRQDHHDEMHAAHRQDVRQSAQPKRLAVAPRHVGLAKNERSGERRHARGVVPLDRAPHGRAHAVDPGAEAVSALLDAEIEHGPAHHHPAERQGDTRIAQAWIVPELDRREIGERHDAIVAAKALGGAEQSGDDGPRARAVK